VSILRRNVSEPLGFCKDFVTNRSPSGDRTVETIRTRDGSPLAAASASFYGRQSGPASASPPRRVSGRSWQPSTPPNDSGSPRRSAPRGHSAEPRGFDAARCEADSDPNCLDRNEVSHAMRHATKSTRRVLRGYFHLAVLAAALLVSLASSAVRSQQPPILPDPKLTPGATLPVTKDVLNPSSGLSRTFGDADQPGAGRPPSTSRYAASTRARSRSKLARPYICRLMTFSRVTCPSTGPLLQGSSNAAVTAASSRSRPVMKRCNSGARCSTPAPATRRSPPRPAL
jgi:hypothetical protein